MISWQTHQILQPDLRPELFRKDLRQKKGVQAFGLWASHSSNGFLARLRMAAKPPLSLPSAQQPPSPISAPHHTVGLAQGAKRLDVTDQLAATCTQEWRALPRGPESAVPTKPLPAENRRAPPTCLTSLETTKGPPL
jgi:hypothetical protein